MGSMLRDSVLTVLVVMAVVNGQPGGFQNPPPGRQRPGTPPQGQGPRGNVPQQQTCRDLEAHNAVGIQQYLVRGVQLCGENFERWLSYISILDNQEIRNMSEAKLLFANVMNWEKICSHWTAAVRCVLSLQPTCSLQWAARQLKMRTSASFPYNKNEPQPYLAFSDRVCQNGQNAQSGQLIQVIKQTLMDRNINPSCINTASASRMAQCIERSSKELQVLAERVVGDVRGLYMAQKGRFDRLARESLACAYSIITKSRCNPPSAAIWRYVVRLQMPSFFNVVELEATPLPNITDAILTASGQVGVPEAMPARTCTLGLYGYTHIMPCNIAAASQMVTCSLVGEVVLLSNEFLEIRGSLHRAQGRGVTVTVLQKINIDLKGSGGTRVLGTYSLAENKPMPSTFSNNATVIEGVAVGRRMQGNKEKVIIVKDNPRVVIILRRWTEGLFLTMGTDSHFIKRSSGLLASGCPRQAIIRREELIRQLTNRGQIQPRGLSTPRPASPPRSNPNPPPPPNFNNNPPPPPPRVKRQTQNCLLDCLMSEQQPPPTTLDCMERCGFGPTSGDLKKATGAINPL